MSRKLGELLVAQGAITEFDVGEALKLQKIYGGRLGTTLVEMEKITFEQLSDALGRQLGLPVVDAKQLQAEVPAAKSLLDAAKVERFEALPLRVDPRRPHVAMISPQNFALVEELQFLLGVRLQLHVLPELLFFEHAERYYGVKPPLRYLKLSAEGPARPNLPVAPAAPLPPGAEELSAQRAALFGGPATRLSEGDPDDTPTAPPPAPSAPAPATVISPPAVPVATPGASARPLVPGLGGQPLPPRTSSNPGTIPALAPAAHITPGLGGQPLPPRTTSNPGSIPALAPALSPPPVRPVVAPLVPPRSISNPAMPAIPPIAAAAQSESPPRPAPAPNPAPPPAVPPAANLLRPPAPIGTPPAVAPLAPAHRDDDWTRGSGFAGLLGGGAPMPAAAPLAPVTATPSARAPTVSLASTVLPPIPSTPIQQAPQPPAAAAPPVEEAEVEVELEEPAEEKPGLEAEAIDVVDVVDVVEDPEPVAAVDIDLDEAEPPSAAPVPVETAPAASGVAPALAEVTLAPVEIEGEPIELEAEPIEVDAEPIEPAPVDAAPVAAFEAAPAVTVEAAPAAAVVEPAPAAVTVEAAPVGAVIEPAPAPLEVAPAPVEAVPAAAVVEPALAPVEVAPAPVEAVPAAAVVEPAPAAVAEAAPAAAVVEPAPAAVAEAVPAPVEAAPAAAVVEPVPAPALVEPAPAQPPPAPELDLSGDAGAPLELLPPAADLSGPVSPATEADSSGFRLAAPGVREFEFEGAADAVDLAADIRPATGIFPAAIAAEEASPLATFVDQAAQQLAEVQDGDALVRVLASFLDAVAERGAVLERRDGKLVPVCITGASVDATDPALAVPLDAPSSFKQCLDSARAWRGELNELAEWGFASRLGPTTRSVIIPIGGGEARWVAWGVIPALLASTPADHAQFDQLADLAAGVAARIISAG